MTQDDARRVAQVTQHQAQLEMVRASLGAVRHPDVYGRRKPRPAPIQPPLVDSPAVA